MTLEQYLKSLKPQMTHAGFAALINATQATVTRYIAGDRFPSPDMIERIAKTTGGAVTINDWYERRAKLKRKKAAAARKAARIEAHSGETV